MIIDRIISEGGISTKLFRSITPMECQQILDFLNAQDRSDKFMKVLKYVSADDIEKLKKIRV